MKTYNQIKNYQGFILPDNTHDFTWLAIRKKINYENKNYFSKTTNNIIVSEVEIINEDHTKLKGEICYLVEVNKFYKNNSYTINYKHNFKKLRFLYRNGLWHEHNNPNRKRFPKEIRTALSKFKNNLQFI